MTDFSSLGEKLDTAVEEHAFFPAAAVNVVFDINNQPWHSLKVC